MKYDLSKNVAETDPEAPITYLRKERDNLSRSLSSFQAHLENSQREVLEATANIEVFKQEIVQLEDAIEELKYIMTGKQNEIG